MKNNGNGAGRQNAITSFQCIVPMQEARYACRNHPNAPVKRGVGSCCNPLCSRCSSSSTSEWPAALGPPLASPGCQPRAARSFSAEATSSALRAWECAALCARGRQATALVPQGAAAMQLACSSHTTPPTTQCAAPVQQARPEVAVALSARCSSSPWQLLHRPGCEPSPGVPTGMLGQWQGPKKAQPAAPARKTPPPKRHLDSGMHTCK
jgi:hypothetical protein